MESFNTLLAFARIHFVIFSLFGMCAGYAQTITGSYQIVESNIILSYSVNTTNNEVTILDCNSDASGDLIIPERVDGYTVVTIANRAFYNCPSLNKIILPETVRAIEPLAFSYCRNLTDLYLGSALTFFGLGALTECDLLENISVNPDNTVFVSVDGVLYLRDLESNSGLPDLLIQYPRSRLGPFTIPSSVTTIASEAFEKCYSLTSLVLSPNLTLIDEYAFSECRNLTSLSFGSAAVVIGENAFYKCESLTELDLGVNVQALSRRAFYGCSALKSVTIPASVRIIGEAPFSGCSELVSIEVDESNTDFCEIDGALYRLNSETGLPEFCIQYALARPADFRFPESVTEVGPRAFIGSLNLTSVIIGEHIEKIGETAFYECPKLKSIIFEGNRPSISQFGAGSTGINPRLYAYSGATGFYVLSYALSGKKIYYLNEEDGLSDNDGDGWPDILEKNLQTHPLKKSDHLRFWISGNGDNLNLHYAPHSSECSFEIEWNTDLLDSEKWASLSQVQFYGDGDGQSAEIPSEGLNSAFYRLKVSILT